MRNKKILFISIFILIIAFSIAAVSAEDSADDAIASGEDITLKDSESVSGTVSGGVDVETENPGTTSGELNYNIPDDAKTIKSADVYVNVYSGSAANTYGANANITITTANGDTNKNESLWIEQGTTDGTVYTVNDHTTKCYSDYMIHYNVTGLLNGLNGTKVTVKVDTFNMTDKQFDGRIKLIALILAYDDGDTDSISYFVNSNQLWSKSDVNVTFDTESVTNVDGASLTNIVLSSGDGTYRLNDELIGDASNHSSGFYYQYNRWDDVTGLIKVNQKNTLNVAYAGTSTYGSIKNVLSILTVNNLICDVAIQPEYTSIPSAYASTNNTLTVTVNTNKAGKYSVKLLADGTVVSQGEFNLTAGSNTVLLTDPTIRPVDASTVNGAENNNVTYTIELDCNNKTVAENSITLPVLYNGNLGKDLAYPAGGFDDVVKFIVNGDVVVDVKEESSYLGSDAMNRTDVWTINLDENSTMVKSYIYVPYNWCNPGLIAEDANMINATFNGVKVAPAAFYRDQGNLGKYGGYGYGVLVYDVTGLVNETGNNTLLLNKNAKTPAVYPSVLLYMYNTTVSNTIKEIYLINGADLLANSNNNAGRVAKADSTIDVYSKLSTGATLYVFAAGAQSGEGNIIFNGVENVNVWSGTSSTSDLFTLDVTGKVKDKNSISFVATGSTILALQQMIVLTKDLNESSISLAPEYTSVPSAYAGTNNLITITIDTVKSGKYTIELYADGNKVNSTDADLVYGTNKVALIDPTIREVNETTVNGAANKKVNYTVKLIGDGNVVEASVILPVLYNGNLGKDLAYPAGGYESFLNITINGDIVIDIKDVSSYLSAGAMGRTDIWAIDLDSKSSIVKSYVYVPYNWFNGKTYTEDVNMFNVTFNGVNIAPVAMYRDQGNLGNYGMYGYGVLVYDVTALANNGNNTLVLNKKNATPAVYPSALVYMYNTTGSAMVKNVYISNGADLLAGTSNNLAKRPVKADSTIDVAVADTAKLYIFAASAQAGEGNVVFNGNVYENVWSGTSSTTDLYALDITDSVKGTNNISFVATGSTILALQQIIVTTQKAPTTITAPGVTTVYNNNKNLVMTLKETDGNVISGAKLTVVFNGVTKELTTDAKGQATLAIPANLVPKSYNAVITYNGDDNHIKSTATAKVTVKKASVKLTAKKKVTFKAKVKTKKLTVTLKDNKGKAMKKVKLTLKVKKKTIKATTNKKGKATFKIKNLKKKANVKAKITFKGDKYFNKATKTVKIKVKK